ncbi:hypothetical protein DSECCO2_25710 [anaerobic digester metagenome]
MSYNKGIVATLAELEDFYKGQKAGDIIELMNQTNDIITDVPFMEANQTDGHLTRVRTGLPNVYWRRLYQGTPPSKSQWTQVKEGCGILEAIMELDVEEINLYGDKAKAFRLSEGKPFTESMRQKVAATMFYGDSNKNPDEFNGLAMRYPSKSSPNVIDAGGTGNACTSMYLTCWGANTAHGLYPKGSTGGLASEDLGKYMTTDPDGKKFQVVGDKYNWRCGLTVRDWRAVVRIANIPLSALTLKKTDSGFIDLHRLTIMAKNKMPETMRNQAIWYCNADVLTALELQATDAGNVTLTYRTEDSNKGGPLYKSTQITSIHARPIRQCDVLRNDEKAI